MTQKEIFIERLNKLKEDPDFIGMKLIPNLITDETNRNGLIEESLYEELNRMFNAPDLPDPEVLGKYSL
jgi:hypothetical protein